MVVTMLCQQFVELTTFVCECQIEKRRIELVFIKGEDIDEPSSYFCFLQAQAFDWRQSDNKVSKLNFSHIDIERLNPISDLSGSHAQ